MKVHNSLTNEKELFIPIEHGIVKLYVCGQTVYDYCHIGHARKEVVFFMIRKWFLANDYEVLFVENITDIDDKIINKSKETSKTLQEITEYFINAMYEDFDKLGVFRPSLAPRATDYIDEMCDIIENLLNNGHAYRAKNNDIYFSVKTFPDYGKLSCKNLDALQAGARVEIDACKTDANDFVLWKYATESEVHWKTKLGNGRPGWHIECSAMSMATLGASFDIHGGGLDLQFPHHENEIAQSESANKCKFANYWLHNGFLNIHDEKMSKSLNNSFRLRDVLDKHSGETIRFFMLKTHYRSPINFTDNCLSECYSALKKLYNSLKHDVKPAIDWKNHYTQKFASAMNDDFNTPLAISVLFEISGELNISYSIYHAELLLGLANTIGLMLLNRREFFQGIGLSDEIELLINKRNVAKQAKDFKTADAIRKELFAINIVLEDDKDGNTNWRNA